MNRLILSVMTAAAFAAAAHAAPRFTFGAVSGSDGYHGYNAAATIPSGKFYFQPKASLFKTDSSDGYFVSPALRAAYDNRILDTGLEAGFTPKHNGYGQFYGAADATVSLYPGNMFRRSGKDKDAAFQLDLGTKLSVIRHSMDSISGDSEGVTETDLSFMAAAKAAMFKLSGSYTKSLGYSKSLDTLAGPQKTDIDGLITSGAGFLNNSWKIRADYSGFPLITPFVSYVRTAYKAGADSKAYLAGADIKIRMIAITAAYQSFDAGPGVSSKSYFTAGAGLRF